MWGQLVNVSAPRYHYQGVYKQQKFTGPTRFSGTWLRLVTLKMEMREKCAWTVLGRRPLLLINSQDTEVLVGIWYAVCFVMFCYGVISFVGFLKIWNYYFSDYLAQSVHSTLRFLHNYAYDVCTCVCVCVCVCVYIYIYVCTNKWCYGF
jgi:hypothetical protein